MEITEQDYQEYQHLKDVYKRELVYQSMDSIVNLSDDVDEPIKTCVMAFALLGCKPKWSCCGFDYRGQSFHKYHQYGRVFFILTYGTSTASVLNQFYSSGTHYSDKWKFDVRLPDIDFHVDLHNPVEQWRDPSCIHYSESGAVYIKFLEDFLMSLSSHFSDSVVLTDTNLTYNLSVPSWQYKGKTDWVITKEDLLKRYNDRKPNP